MYEGNMFPITANKLNVKKQVNEMKYSLDMKKLEQTRSMSETKFQLITIWVKVKKRSAKNVVFSD